MRKRKGFTLIERIVAVEERETVTLASLPPDVLGAHRKPEAAVALLPGFNLETHLDQVAKRFIQEAGAASGGNLRKAAELLGIGYRSLRYLLDKHQIQSFKKADSPDRRDSGA